MSDESAGFGAIRLELMRLVANHMIDSFQAFAIMCHSCFLMNKASCYSSFL